MRTLYETLLDRNYELPVATMIRQQYDWSYYKYNSPFYEGSIEQVQGPVEASDAIDAYFEFGRKLRNVDEFFKHLEKDECVMFRNSHYSVFGPEVIKIMLIKYTDSSHKFIEEANMVLDSNPVSVSIARKRSVLPKDSRDAKKYSVSQFDVLNKDSDFYKGKTNEYYVLSPKEYSEAQQFFDVMCQR